MTKLHSFDILRKYDNPAYEKSKRLWARVRAIACSILTGTIIFLGKCNDSFR